MGELGASTLCIDPSSRKKKGVDKERALGYYREAKGLAKRKGQFCF